MIPSLCACEQLITDPWFADTTTTGRTTYYVNGDTGSDSNDGSLAHPFATLTPVQSIPAGTTVVVYPTATAYAVPTGGLTMVGGGEAAPARFIGAPGLDRPVIDALPYTLSGHMPPDSQGDIRVRQIVDVSGSHCRIEHLDLQNGFRHLVVIRGSHIVLRDCHIDTAFEDTIKVTAEAADQTLYILVTGNDVEAFASQGIDCAGPATNGNDLIGIRHVWITRNAFHDPQVDFTSQTYLANGIGMKSGCQDMVVTQNVLYNIPGAVQRGCLELGGAGANFDMATLDVIASDNRITGYAGPAIVASSAIRCGIYRHLIDDCLIGIKVGLDEDTHTSQPNSAYCSDVHLGENELHITTGGAMVRVTSDLDGTRFDSEANTYDGDNTFVQRAVPVTWATFTAWLNTDTSSHGF